MKASCFFDVVGSALLLGSVTGNATAGSWHPISPPAWVMAAQGTAGVTAYYDANSIVRMGKSAVRVWTKYEYSTPQQNPNVFGAKYVAVKELDYFDCSAQTVEVESDTWYTASGGDAGSNDYSSNASHIVPNTVEAGVFNAVCEAAMK